MFPDCSCCRSLGEPAFGSGSGSTASSRLQCGYFCFGHGATFGFTSRVRRGSRRLRTIMESFFTESAFYLIAAGFVQSLGAFLIAPFFFAIAHHLSKMSFRRLLHAYLVFNAFLLFWG